VSAAGGTAAAEATSASVSGELPAADAHANTGGPPRHRRKPEHRADRSQRERPPAKRFERREKMPDPNSPFAKLAALKAQLEADAKERH